MKLTQQFTIILIVLLSFSIACYKPDPPQEDAFSATLYDYTGLDGCSWVIKLENNEVLEPTNIKALNYKLIDGKKAWIKYSPLADQASICMVGQIVEIEAIWDR